MQRLAGDTREYSWQPSSRQAAAADIPACPCTDSGFFFCSLQQDTLTDQHSFLDDLCSLAGAAALSPLLQVSIGHNAH